MKSPHRKISDESLAYILDDDDKKFRFLKEIGKNMGSEITPNSIFDSENHLEKFKSLEPEIFVDDIYRIYKLSLRNDNFEIYSYIRENYDSDYYNCKNFYNYVCGDAGKFRLGHFTSSIKIFTDMIKTLPNDYAILKNFRKNFYEGNCDMVSFILDNFEISKLSKISLSFYSDNIDCFNLIINKSPNLFDFYEDHTVICDIKIATALMFYGFGTKINPFSFVNLSPYYISLKKDEMNIMRFITERKGVNSENYLDFLRIILLVPEFLDHENVFGELWNLKNDDNKHLCVRLIYEIRKNRSKLIK